MARLAIRATGDRGREKVTTGNNVLEADVIIQNKHIGTMVVHDYHNRYELHYYPQGTGRTILHVEQKTSETHS